MSVVCYTAQKEASYRSNGALGETVSWIEGLATG